MSEPRSFLFDDRGSLIKTRHSFYEPKSPDDSEQTSKTDTFSRSDINIIRTIDFPSIIDSGRVNRRGSSVTETTPDEYYKNYEHDEVPVKESSCLGLGNDLFANDVEHPYIKDLTDSDLEKLETRVFQNMSKELPTEVSSPEKQDYNIKLFQTTVLEILDKFYGNMQDFEIYKKKFHDILSKNKENLVDEMEDFIKEMIQNIVSSESCISSGTNAKNRASDGIGTEDTFEDDSRTVSLNTGKYHIGKQKTVEAYKNENYFTDSTFDDGTSKIVSSDNRSCSMYMLKGNLNGEKGVEIKNDGRNLLSEVNIGNGHSEDIDQIASADNVRSVAAKRLQMTNYMKQAERGSSDTIIPVKISYAKKNIHSEDCPDELDENNKSFIYKICNFLCKKLRKTSFG